MTAPKPVTFSSASSDYSGLPPEHLLIVGDVPGGGGEVEADDITDSGSTGREVLRSSSGSDARDAINAASSSDLADLVSRVEVLEDDD